MSAEWAAHSSQSIQPTSTTQKTLFGPVNLSLMHFIKYIKGEMNPFSFKTIKKDIVSYGDHGTERVNTTGGAVFQQ
jgi:hypothetical protein